MNKYPAKPLMDEMAKYGRYGDSMLVHMHPAEVEGLASLVPGGKLPRNPVTGQPEAFYFIIPMLMKAAGASLTALQSAAITGAASAIGNKDIGKGVLDGITAGATAGIGDALRGVLKAGTDTATQLATQSAAEGTAKAAAEGTAKAAAEGAVQAAVDSGGDIMSAIGAGGAGATPVPPVGIEQALAENIDAAALQGKVSDFSMSQIGAPEAQGLGSAMVPSTQPQGLSFSDKVDLGVKNLGTTGQLGIGALAQGAKGDMEMREAARARANALRAEGEADRREAYDDLQRGYAMAQPGIPTGLSGARSEMSRRTPPPMYMAEGGQTYPGGQDENPYARQYASLGAARDIARFMGGPRGYMGVDPVTVQQRLRGPDVVAPPRDYMPGFEPEFNYFQNLARDPDGNIVGTPDVPDRSYRPMRQGVISRSQYFDPVLQAPQSNAQVNEYRRTLEKLDPGPLDEATVMGLASEGSVLSPMQQNMFQQYAPLAPFNTAQRGRISELMDRGMSMSQAIDNQQSSRVKGYDLDGDGVVTNAEFAQATAKPETPDVPDYVEGLSPEQQAAIKEYMQTFDPDTAKFLASLMTGGLGSIGSFMAEGGEAEGKKMPEVGPAPTAGDIPIRTSMMEGTVPDGGIARVPTEFTANESPSKAELTQDLAMLEKAVMGDVEQVVADQIVESFIRKYGNDAYRTARDAMLKSVVPDAQTEGLIRGNGSGMDDQVQGMIGRDQPVAVSPGEYIVAADVVSGLGEGSTDAGVKDLDRMQDEVRRKRNGTTQQAPRIDERKVMPA